MPNPPPTSPTTTRTDPGGMPSTASASSSRSPVGVWQLTRSVSRPLAASTLASVARGSIGEGIRRWLTRSRHHVRGRRAREGVGDLRGMAVAHLARDVPGRVGPHERRARGDGRARVRHRRQRFVANVDRLGRVACLVHRLRDDRRHRLADVAHGAHRERVVRRCRGRRAIRTLEVRGRHQRPHARTHEVLAGQDRDDPRHRCGGLRVDRRDDARVRMRRAQHVQDRACPGSAKLSANWPRPVSSASSSTRRTALPLP